MQQDCVHPQMKMRSWRSYGSKTGPTYYLDVYVSAVGRVLDLNRQSVLSRVGSLCGADEEDGIYFTGTNSHCFVLQWNIVFEPGDDRARFTLYLEQKASKTNSLARLSFIYSSLNHWYPFLPRELCSSFLCQRTSFSSPSSNTSRATTHFCCIVLFITMASPLLLTVSFFSLPSFVSCC